MVIVVENNDYMFSIFEKDNIYYMTAVAGTIGLYNITIELSKAEVDFYGSDENRAIAAATDLISRPDAYKNRIITPAIDPE